MSKENIIEYKKKNPVLGKDVFIASGVKIIGDVIISDNSSVWYNCVIRADVNFVRIGKCTNIQDGTVIHVSSQGFSATGSKGAPTIIENNVTMMPNCFFYHRNSPYICENHVRLAICMPLDKVKQVCQRLRKIRI